MLELIRGHQIGIKVAIRALKKPVKKVSPKKMQKVPQFTFKQLPFNGYDNILLNS